ncbi:hypothetical protein [Halomonas caseinilytica]|nr:hypothetical protein [Halomonas caseinilytica]
MNDERMAVGHVGLPRLAVVSTLVIANASRVADGRISQANVSLGSGDK